MSSYTNVDVSELSVMSALQEEEMWVEYSCQEELDNIRLAISRALGVPEPVLYDDIDEDAEQKEESEDWDRVLDDVVDIQERMATGMKMIQECNRVIDNARQEKESGGNGLPYNAYVAWVERRKKLWSHWKDLKTACDAQIGEDKWLWTKYFSLAGTMIDMTGYTGDEIECPYHVCEYDDQKMLWLESEECVEV